MLWRLDFFGNKKLVSSKNDALAVQQWHINTSEILSPSASPGVISMCRSRVNPDHKPKAKYAGITGGRKKGCDYVVIVKHGTSSEFASFLVFKANCLFFSHNEIAKLLMIRFQSGSVSTLSLHQGQPPSIVLPHNSICLYPLVYFYKRLLYLLLFSFSCINPCIFFWEEGAHWMVFRPYSQFCSGESSGAKGY